MNYKIEKCVEYPLVTQKLKKKEGECSEVENILREEELTEKKWTVATSEGS